jgi:hypothetical protein
MIVSLHIVQKFKIKSFALSYGMAVTLQSGQYHAFCWEVHWISLRKGRFPLPLSSWYSSVNPRSVCWIYIQEDTDVLTLGYLGLLGDRIWRTDLFSLLHVMFSFLCVVTLYNYESWTDKSWDLFISVLNSVQQNNMFQVLLKQEWWLCGSSSTCSHMGLCHPLCTERPDEVIINKL